MDADDTQLYSTHSCDDDSDPPSPISRIERYLRYITDWMTVNKLKLNTDKTELLVCHSKFGLT